jgi:hypothetical protein
MSANAVATMLLARRLHGAPALGPLANTFARASGIAALAGAAAAAVLRGRPGVAGAVLDLAFGGVAFGVVGAAGIALLGDESLRSASSRIVRGVFRRRRS